MKTPPGVQMSPNCVNLGVPLQLSRQSRRLDIPSRVSRTPPLGFRPCRARPVAHLAPAVGRNPNGFPKRSRASASSAGTSVARWPKRQQLTA